MIKGLKHLSQKEKPRELGLFREELAPRDLTDVHKYLKGVCKDRGSLCSLVPVPGQEALGTK